MPPVRLVVDLGRALADRGHDPAGIEHHARDRVVVGVGVVDGAGPEVPDLGGPVSGEISCGRDLMCCCGGGKISGCGRDEGGGMDGGGKVAESGLP